MAKKRAGGQEPDGNKKAASGKPIEPLFTINAHTGPVTALAVAPDGKTLVSGGSDKAVHLWDLFSAQPRRTVSMAEKPWAIAEVAISPDGKMVAAISRGVNRPVRTRAYLWNLILRTETELKEIEPGVELSEDDVGNWFFSSPTFSSDSKSVASLLRHLSFYCCGTGACLEAPDLGQTGSRLAYSPKGTFRVLGNRKGPLHGLDVAKKRQTSCLEGHTDSITALAFSPDGTWLASASSPCFPGESPVTPEDRSIRLWDFEGGKQKREWTDNWGTTAHLVFLADNRHLVSFHVPSGQARLILWNAKDKEQVASWQPEGGAKAVAVWSGPASSRSVSGLVATGHEDGTIKFWDLATVFPATAGIEALKWPPSPPALGTGEWRPIRRGAQKAQPNRSQQKAKEDKYFAD
jgi:WD40 repeat protein